MCIRAKTPAAAVVMFALIFATLPRAAVAQSGSEGVFLLLPVGARAVGMGEAVVAQRFGSDLLWWNPAGIAGDTLHEVALHHSTTAPGQGNAIALLLPSHMGAFGVSLNVLDLGRQAETAEDGTQIGVITPTDFAVGLTYAVAPVPLLAFGVTAKHVDASIHCSGICTDLPTQSSTANAFDVGAQLRLTDIPLTFGIAARHLGIRGGSSSPGRIDVGGDYRIQAVERATSHIQAHAAVGVISTTRADSLAATVGTDVIVDQRLHVRAGYIRDRDRSRASVGVGLSSGKLTFDIARTFGGLADNSERGPPTYFSLRYLW